MEFQGHELEWLTLGVLLLTMIAIVYGPIKAVKITRKLDEERERLNRKLSVFRTLMQTRRARTNQDHAGALNLIEVQFYDIEPVRAAYRIYVRHLGSALPTPDQQDRYFEEREDLYADLLHAMGLSLGYTFDKRELMRLAYVPILWQDDFMLQRRNATLLAEVLEGARPLPISPFQPKRQSPFPPPLDTFRRSLFFRSQIRSCIASRSRMPSGNSPCHHRPCSPDFL